MKRLFSLLIIFGLSFILIGCGNSKNAENKAVNNVSTAEKNVVNKNELPNKNDDNEAITITFGAPQAPPTLPLLHMMDTKALGENVNFNLDIWSDPETLIAMVQDHKHDIYAFPLTVIAKLYNKGMDVRLLNVNTWGVDYFLTTDPNFKTWQDLKGKTLYVPLQSSPVDALSQYLIHNAGLVLGEDVEIKYGSKAEIASLVTSGQAEYAVLIEPQVSKVLMSNDKVRVAMSLEKEWQRVTKENTRKPTAGIGTTQKFIDEHPELVDKFQDAYKNSLEWVKANPEEASKLAEKYLGLKAPIVIKAIPNMGLNFTKATDAKDELEKFYKLLLDFNPKLVGGKLPDENLYYGK